jgi:hypothetical protein
LLISFTPTRNPPMFVHAPAYLSRLQVERLIAQPDLAALLEEAEHQLK